MTIDTRQRAADRKLVFAHFAVHEGPRTARIRCTACNQVVLAHLPSPCSPDTYRDVLLVHLRACSPDKLTP